MGEQRRVFAGLRLCSTGLELDVKEQVRKIIVACGGQFQDDLDPEVTTHLVAEAVGSQKHRAAVTHELTVVSPRWVFESFRAQKLLDVKDFGLKLLEGMGICTAGLEMEEKETVAQLATTHGAQYDGRLELGFTSVLIAQHPDGAKYEAAVANEIPVVHLGWLYACLERGMVVDEEEFMLQQQAADSSLQPTYIAVGQQKNAQELVAALPDIVRKYHHGHMENGENNDVEDKDWMDLFDGCGLYLLGFPPQMNALLQRLVRTSMGTIYHNVVLRQVSHVIVSASLSDKQTLEAIQARVIAANTTGEVHFVSASWLLDCVKCLDIQPEALYPVEFDVHVPDPAQGTSTLPTGDGFGVSERTDYIEQKHVETANESNSGPIVLSEDLLQNGDGNSILLSPEKVKHKKRAHIFSGYSFLLLCRDSDDKYLVKPLLKSIRGERGGAEAIAIADIDFPHLDPEQFSFVSHVVMCTGAVVDEKEALRMQERIHQIQRELRNHDDIGEDDTEGDGVDEKPRKRARHDKKPRQRMLQFVSDLWVSCSLAARTKLSYSSHELFNVSTNRPRALFSSPVPLPEFRDVIASTSLYVDVEHLVVLELLRIAGAHVTRKLNAQNTHLICRKSESMKFVKATEWGLRVVKARWVVDSLLQGRRLSEDSPEYQVVDEEESSNFTLIANDETILSQSSPRSVST
ncbi:hypothetical protein PHMEG_00088 [Phytophthora megakarya]|uniref:BRCT domain-containing protein n=1 Tax=Phytophthora megakarya TaxID=4795 RepID=A0A225X3Z9_9STRA|nr:hypothetical protein PHMEG_00088 [Phytophthora megakarya]